MIKSINSSKRGINIFFSQFISDKYKLKSSSRSVYCQNEYLINEFSVFKVKLSTRVSLSGSTVHSVVRK